MLPDCKLFICSALGAVVNGHQTVSADLSSLMCRRTGAWPLKQGAGDENPREPERKLSRQISFAEA